MTAEAPAPVLHAIEAFCGGALVSCAQLCHLIQDRPAIVLHGHRPETPADFADKFPKGTLFIPWDIGASIDPIRDIRGMVALRKVIDRHQPAVIHAHSSKAGGLVRMTVPFGHPPVFYSPRCYAYLRQDIGPVSRFVYRCIEMILARTRHRTIACGHDEGRISVCPPSRLIVIPNGIDPDEFDVSPEKPLGDRVTIVGVGRDAPSKNLPLFMRIAARMAGERVRFLWVGDADTQRYANIEHVRITGFLPRDRCLGELASADIFLQTSLWEGLPRAVLEAMAMGIPVLAYPSVGSSELVASGEGGRLCRDEDEFVAAIERLLKDPALHARLRAGARQTVERHYNISTIQRQWKDLYRSVVLEADE